jgi:hypothetical protein
MANKLTPQERALLERMANDPALPQATRDAFRQRALQEMGQVDRAARQINNLEGGVIGAAFRNAPRGVSNTISAVERPFDAAAGMLERNAPAAGRMVGQGIRAAQNVPGQVLGGVTGFFLGDRAGNVARGVGNTAAAGSMGRVRRDKKGGFRFPWSN